MSLRLFTVPLAGTGNEKGKTAKIAEALYDDRRVVVKLISVPQSGAVTVYLSDQEGHGNGIPLTTAGDNATIDMTKGDRLWAFVDDDTAAHVYILSVIDEDVPNHNLLAGIHNILLRIEKMLLSVLVR